MAEWLRAERKARKESPYIYQVSDACHLTQPLPTNCHKFCDGGTEEEEEEEENASII